MKFLISVILIMTAQFAHSSIGGHNGTTNLGNFLDVKCSTGVTCSRDKQKLKIVSSPSLVGPLTLERGAILSNPTSYDVSIASSGDTSLTVKGGEAKNAILNLYADEGDDSADKFSVRASADGTMHVQANSVSGLSMNSSGDVSILKALVSTINTFASGDTTPSVANGHVFKTFAANTVTITAFDDVVDGQEFLVLSQGPATFDVTGSSIICGTTDIITASGDATRFVYDGSKSRCTSYMDIGKNHN